MISNLNDQLKESWAEAHILDLDIYPRAEARGNSANLVIKKLLNCHYL